MNYSYFKIKTKVAHLTSSQTGNTQGNENDINT
jgi:hypothetical protein